MSNLRFYGVAVAAALLSAIGVPLLALSGDVQPPELPAFAKTPDPQLTQPAALELAVSQPVLSEDRKPPSKVDPTLALMGTSGALAIADAPVQTPPLMASPQLVGIIRHSTGKAIALFKRADGQSQLGAPGEKVDGWSIAAINRNKVILSQGAERKTVEIAFPNRTSSSVLPAEAPIPLPPMDQSAAALLSFPPNAGMKP